MNTTKEQTQLAAAVFVYEDDTAMVKKNVPYREDWINLEYITKFI